MFYSLILLLFVTKSESTLKMVFSDEFNESSLDENKWFFYNETKPCYFHNYLSCFSSNPGNLRLIGGTLVMTTIRQKYLNKFYTTSYMRTIESFIYGRIEIRAALPRAKMITSSMMLFPAITNKEGKVDIFYNHQTQDLFYGFPIKNDKYVVNSTTVEENLNEFNIYVLEWTQTHITWIFNGRTIKTFNATQEFGDNYNPLINPFKLSIYMAIGGHYDGGEGYYPGQILYEKDADQWNCSLLIIDYIRIYQNVTENNWTDTQPIKETSTFVHELPPENNITSSYICRLVMASIQPKKPSWKLLFSDEFTNETLDQNKWDVQDNSGDCQGNHNKQLNCNTNSSANVRLTDGILVLAAIREKYMKSDFTAPLISTKRSFKYGKFEIRAALPQGKMLRPYIYMEPTEKHNKDSTVSTKDGRIDILSNTQLQEFYYGIHFAFDNNKKYSGKTAKGTNITDSLFKFHTYVMEWTETEIRWMFDNKHLFTASIHQELGDNYNPFDKTFQLVISLGVGGIEFFPGQSLKEEEADKWPCSLLNIDYINVNEFSSECSIINTTEQNNISSFEICENIMPLIRKNIAKGPNSLFIVLVSIFSFLLILIPLNIFLFLRFKKSRETQDIGQHNEKDIQLELYDEVGVMNIYSDPDSLSNLSSNAYEECVYTDFVEQNRNSGLYLKLEEYGNAGHCEENYLVMTNKNI